MKNIFILFVFLGLGSIIYGQDKPYSDGSYEFRIFDKEYQKSTAICKVTNTGPGSLPVSDPEFEFSSTRIDFNRRMIIHY